MESERTRCVYLEYSVVEEDHNDAGDVERRQRRVDDKVRIIEHAQCRVTRGRVIEAKDDG